MNHKYYGLTHINIPRFLYPLWRWWYCKQQKHLFDEVLTCDGDTTDGSDGWHWYLVCDICGYIVEIKNIKE
jgi:hypothetical protein